jgi:hypothetical protein
MSLQCKGIYGMVTIAMNSRLSVRLCAKRSKHKPVHSPRSGREHKAWGVSPRSIYNETMQAREAGESAVARCAGSRAYFFRVPGAYAPGFILAPASQADQSNVTLVILNSICFQKRNELIAKRKFLMMLFLTCNILLHLLQV